MKIYLLILGIVMVLFPHIAQTQSSYESQTSRRSITADIDRLNSSLSDVSRRKDRSVEEIARLRREVDTISSDIHTRCATKEKLSWFWQEANYQCFRNDGRRGMSYQTLLSLQERKDSHQRDIDRLESTVDDYLNEMNDLRRQIGSRTDEFQNLGHLRDVQIRGLSVLVGLRDVTDDLDSIDETLNDIERVYDRGLLGIYLQDKIGQLLNSRVMCKAYSKCLNRGDEISSREISRELFSEETSGRRGSYQQRLEQRRRGDR